MLSMSTKLKLFIVNVNNNLVLFNKLPLHLSLVTMKNSKMPKTMSFIQHLHALAQVLYQDGLGRHQSPLAKTRSF